MICQRFGSIQGQCMMSSLDFAKCALQRLFLDVESADFKLYTQVVVWFTEMVRLL